MYLLGSHILAFLAGGTVAGFALGLLKGAGFREPRREIDWSRDVPATADPVGIEWDLSDGEPGRLPRMVYRGRA